MVAEIVIKLHKNIGNNEIPIKKNALLRVIWVILNNQKIMVANTALFTEFSIMFIAI